MLVKPAPLWLFSLIPLHSLGSGLCKPEVIVNKQTHVYQSVVVAHVGKSPPSSLLKMQSSRSHPRPSELNLWDGELKSLHLK